MYEAAIADCRNCTIGTAPVTEPGRLRLCALGSPVARGAAGAEVGGARTGKVKSSKSSNTWKSRILA